MTDWNDWNKRVTEEFRANNGKVGGQFEGRPIVLITHTGAKSGAKRTTPLVYMPDGDRMVIIASKGGAPTNPDWYHNLVKNPKITVEVGTEAFDAHARVAEGKERDKLYARLAKLFPGFDELQQKITRRIPVVILERLGGDQSA
jgi:deazaflavin-dependent oxidoreductase (nitroreductase family)